jgi:hypothetical protein
MIERGGFPPTGVAERLRQLAAISIPERDAEARQRLEREARGRTEPFAIGVARRLEELRALSDLASYLHHGQARR